jgi:hypothetical protein
MTAYNFDEYTAADSTIDYYAAQDYALSLDALTADCGDDCTACPRDYCPFDGKRYDD